MKIGITHRVWLGWMIVVGVNSAGACGNDVDQNPSSTTDTASLSDISPVEPVDWIAEPEVHGKDIETVDTITPIDSATPIDTPTATDIQKDPCPVGQMCTDNDPCTFGDRCELGRCVGNPYACDDGRPCTLDTCVGNGDCTFLIQNGFCLVGALCFEDGETSPVDPCGLCDSKLSQNEFSDAGADPCSDGNECTAGDHCESGTCVGIPVDCNDNNPCTQDVCIPAEGCVYSPFANTLCSDGNACTVEDHCGTDGQCIPGPPMPCEDGNPCTTDVCDPNSGCTQTPNDHPCNDGDVCTVDDFCQAGGCVSGEAAACNDGNSCTDDSCDPETGCNHVLADNNPCCTGGANVCDDSNPCTVDICDPVTSACQYETYTGGCNDFNPCTTADSCIDGACIGKPKECTDGNPCTVDGCALGKCTHTTVPDGTTCDDGQDCSITDQCIGGLCTADLSGCACVPSFSAIANKINVLAIGKDGQPGSGVDVDNNVVSCSPASNCSGGIDNTLSAIAGFANDPLTDAIAAGTIVLLLEHNGYKGTSEPYTVHIYTGSPENDVCDIQTVTCDYLVDPILLDVDCNPVVTLANAKVLAGNLTAGGPGSNLPLSLPIAGLAINVTVYNAKIDAKVTLAAGKITSMAGVLGGAVKKSELKAAISALPDDTFPAGLDKTTIIGFLDILVAEDIDLDKNGTKDAASIGFALNAIGANLVGVVE